MEMGKGKGTGEGKEMGEMEGKDGDGGGEGQEGSGKFGKDDDKTMMIAAGALVLTAFALLCLCCSCWKKSGAVQPHQPPKPGCLPKTLSLSPPTLRKKQPATAYTPDKTSALDSSKAIQIRVEALPADSLPTALASLDLDLERAPRPSGRGKRRSGSGSPAQRVLPVAAPVITSSEIVGPPAADLRKMDL